MPNRAQLIVLLVAAVNLALVSLFPPFDYVSMQRGNIPTFDGFYWIAAEHVNRRLNSSFLALEVIVVLINAAVFWLLVRPRETGAAKRRPGGNRNQRIVLGLMAANLILMLLFPPFENYTAITKATLPTFDGFFYLFGDNSSRQIVTPILYIELALALANGGLLWLMFRDKTRDEISSEQMRTMARNLQSVQKR